MLSPRTRVGEISTTIDVLCYDFLREMKYGKRVAEWLSQPDHHEVCMRELRDIERAIEILGRRKKQEQLLRDKQGQKGPNDGVPPALSPLVMGEVERFTFFHTRLFAYKKDGTKYIEELAKISRENPDLPQTFHAWIIWSGQLERLLGHVKDYIPHLIGQGGDTAIIARILERGVLDFLREDPDYLKKSIHKIELSGERIVTITNLYELYVQLGLGGVEVLDGILAKMDKMRGKTINDIAPVGDGRNAQGSRLPHMSRGASLGSGAGMSGNVRGASESKIVRHTQGGVDRGDNDSHSRSISTRVLSVLARVNGHLGMLGESGIQTDDLVENPFGSVSLSARVPQRIRESLKDLFPNGYFR